MGENIFAQPVAAKGSREQPEIRTSRFVLPEYSVNKGSTADNILAFLKGCAVGFAVLFVFYKLWLLSAIGGIAVGVASIYADRKKRTNTRIRKLRVEFYDMLEAMSVSMRAGNPVLKALESAKEDLELIYSKDSDIIVELTIILERFRNAMPLSAAFEGLQREVVWKMWPASPLFMQRSRENPAGQTRSFGKRSRLLPIKWR